MPTTFANMQEKVYALTKRPELVNLTITAIKLATLRAHQVDFFTRDQTSVVLTYTPPISPQLFVDITTIYAEDKALNIRTPDFMQSEDIVTQVPTENLEYVTDFKHFYNEYNELQQSRFTLMGETLRVRFLSPTGRARLFYFVNPIVTEAFYTSWIANMHADELAMWAAGIVWMRSGFMEIARETQKSSIEPFKELLITSYLTVARR